MPQIPSEFLDASRSRHSVWFAGQRVNQSAIARAAKVDRSYVSHIMAGKRNPSARLLHRLSRVLGMTMDEFMDSLKQRQALIKRRQRTGVQ